MHRFSRSYCSTVYVYEMTNPHFASIGSCSWFGSYNINIVNIQNEDTHHTTVFTI